MLDDDAAVIAHDMRAAEADGALLSSTCDILRESAHDLWALLSFEELILKELTRKPHCGQSESFSGANLTLAYLKTEG